MTVSNGAATYRRVASLMLTAEADHAADHDRYPLLPRRPHRLAQRPC
jgi:hypothetical protein